MKTILTAFAICAFGALLSYLALDWIGFNDALAQGTSTVILGAFPVLRETLEKTRHERERNEVEPSVKSLAAYDVHPALAVLYVTVVGFAVLNFASGLGGIVAALGELAMNGMRVPTALFTVVLAWPLIFLAGRWIGRKCSCQPLLVALAAALGIRVAGTVFDLVFVSAADFEALFGQGKSAGFVVMQLSVGTCIFGALLVGGAALGRKQRLSAYMTYLLKQLTSEGRLALVELAHEEAGRLEREKAKERSGGTTTPGAQLEPGKAGRW